MLTGSNNGTESILGYASGDVFYTFTLDFASTVTFDACASDFDTHLRVWNMEGQFEICGCDDCGDCSPQTVLDCYLEAGTYWFIVEGWGSAEGQYDVEISCPDPCLDHSKCLDDQYCGSDGLCYPACSCSLIEAEAEESFSCPDDRCEEYGLTCSNSRVNGSTVDLPNVLGNLAGDAIFLVNLERTTEVTFDSCGSDFDTVLRVYDIHFSEELCACNNCGDCGVMDVINCNLKTGAYWLVVDGGAFLWNQNTEGHFSVDMRCGCDLHDECDSDQYCAQTGICVDACFCQQIEDSVDGICPTGCSSTGNGNGNDADSGVTVACDGSVNGTTVGLPNLTGQPSGDAVYLVVIDNPTEVLFNACASEFDTFLHVYRVASGFSDEVCQCDDCQDCEDCAYACGTHFATAMECYLEAGEYFLVINGFNSSEGMYELDMTCAPTCANNDECNDHEYCSDQYKCWDACVCHLFEDSMAGDCPTTECETLQCGDHASGSTIGQRNVAGYPAGDAVSHVHLSFDTVVSFDTAGSDFDTNLRVVGANNFTEVLCSNDDYDNSRQAFISECLLDAGDYYVIVDGWHNSEGAYELDVSCAPQCFAHEECDDDKYCDDDNICWPACTCEFFQDPIGNVCPSDRCENYQQCEDHESCLDWEYCSTNLNNEYNECSDACLCFHFDDSVTGNCPEQRCVSLECQSDDDCHPQEYCTLDNRCHDACYCSGFQDAISGECPCDRCPTGCSYGCRSDGDCLMDQYCNEFSTCWDACMCPCFEDTINGSDCPCERCKFECECPEEQCTSHEMCQSFEYCSWDHQCVDACLRPAPPSKDIKNKLGTRHTHTHTTVHIDNNRISFNCSIHHGGNHYDRGMLVHIRIDTCFFF